MQVRWLAIRIVQLDGELFDREMLLMGEVIPILGDNFTYIDITLTRKIYDDYIGRIKVIGR